MPTSILTNSDHFWDVRSKSISFFPARSVAAMNCPSGEQTGKVRFFEPAMVATCDVCKLRILNSKDSLSSLEKTIELPPFAQLERRKRPAPVGSRFGDPPEADTT